jgi:hypothetical protein
VFLYSVILRSTILLLSSSSAAISIVMSETSGPRLPQFFSVTVTEAVTNTVVTSFLGSSDTTMTFFGMQPQSSYRCLIRSTDDQGRVLPVSYLSPVFTALVPPTSFSVSSVNSSTIIASWLHPAGSAAASFYSLTAYLDDDLSNTVISSVNISALSIAGSQTLILSSLVPLKPHRIHLTGFNFRFSNHSSEFAFARLRPISPPACVTAINIFMMPPFVFPFNFRLSWQGPSSFASRDPVYTAAFSAEWLQSNGSRTTLLARAAASSAVIPTPLAAGAFVTVRLATINSVDGLLIDGPFCQFNISVGAMPQLVLKDSDGKLVNGTVSRIFPGQVKIVSFSSGHADAGEVLTVSSTGEHASYHHL